MTAIGILLVINLACHFQSLSGYFAADDFVHVSYLYDVFHGHAGRLLENFTGNWMQTLGTQFYRPLISLTLALDYLIGGGKEFCFHLSNVLYQTGCSIFLFLTTRRLLGPFGQPRATIAAFVAGALFAAAPIHVEVVNWVIGRVDSVCLFFFLASTWLYLRYSDGNNKGSLAGALACFALSLLAKEPAAILPPVLVLFEAFKPDTPDSPVPAVMQRVRTILLKTWPFWLLLAVYFVIRFAALGTLIGGYTGSVGEGFNNSILHRLFGDGSFFRIVFPFNAEVFAPGDKTGRTLSAVYGLIAATFVIRTVVAANVERRGAGRSERVWRGRSEGTEPQGALTSEPVVAANVERRGAGRSEQVWRGRGEGTEPQGALTSEPVVAANVERRGAGRSERVWRYFLIASGWAVLAILPVLQVFNITQTLQCSRFAYAFSAPLCIILALCVVPFWKQGSRPTIFSRIADVAATVLAISLFALFAVIGWRNNGPWQEASDQMRDFRAAVVDAVNRTTPGERIAVISVPDKTRGAHMIYNGAMLSVLLTEPLTTPGIAKRVISFEPVTFGDSNLISVSRLRNLQAANPKLHVFAWSMSDRKLVPLNLVAPNTEQDFMIAANSSDQSIAAPAPNVVPTSSPTKRFLSARIDAPALAIDLVECKVTCKTSSGSKPYAQLFWSGKHDAGFTPTRSLSLPINADGQPHLYRFLVSQNKSWLSCEEIQRLCLEVTSRASNGRAEPVSQLNIDSLRMIDDNRLSPHLAAGDPAAIGNDGICQISGQSAFTFKYDASQVEGADSVVMELSAPNSWFEHYSGALRDTELSDKSWKRIPLKQLAGQFVIHGKDLPASGFYQLRVAALSRNGNVSGYTSDPINLQVSK